MAKGWLEFNPNWLANLFGLESTGRARVDMVTGKVLIEVEHEKIQEDGQVVEGLTMTHHGPVTIPTGWRPKGGVRAPV